MSSRSRQTLSRILLVVLFLQSCGLDVPTGAGRENQELLGTPDNPALSSSSSPEIQAAFISHCAVTSSAYCTEHVQDGLEVGTPQTSPNQQQVQKGFCPDDNTQDEGLLHFIKIHQLQAVSQVPTTLKILCDLWQDNSDALQQYRAPMGLPTLYRRLTDYVWGQFVTGSVASACTDTLARIDKGLLFEDLERIALESLQAGKTTVSLHNIRRMLGREPAEILKTEGFLLFQPMDPQEDEGEGAVYQFPHVTFQE
ncbi:MAG: hypothetical protein AAFU83_03750 [Bacteroidota bacterium]